MLSNLLSNKSVWKILMLYSYAEGAGYNWTELKENTLLQIKSLKIALVNANLVQQPAVAPLSLDILATSLTYEGHEVSILDLTPRAYDWESGGSGCLAK